MNTSWMTGAWLACLAASCGAVQDVKARPADGGAGHAVADDDDGEDDEEKAISLDQVPAAVKKAAEDAVPGFVLKSAETETEEGALHYCLEGTAGGEAVEVEVSTDAKVLEIERGEDDED